MKQLAFNIQQIAVRDGIENPYQLHERTGLHYPTCWTLWNKPPKMIRLSTLQVLCKAFSCTPNDLFSWKGKTEDE